jgi:hypothetical protein
MAVANLAMSSLLEIKNVEGFGWGIDDVGVGRARLSGRLRQPALLQESGDSAECGDIGTRSEELEKLATRSKGRCGLLHTDIPDCLKPGG